MSPAGRTTAAGRVTLLKPTVMDAARLHRFVVETRGLEANTRYAYLLLTKHFRDTCVVALQGDGVVGFVAAYLVPREPQRLFVWQIGVAPELRRSGLAKRMLKTILRRKACRQVNCIEATVGASMGHAGRLFDSLARDLGTTCARLSGFSPRDFEEESHEEEVLFRIGPWERS